MRYAVIVGIDAYWGAELCGAVNDAIDVARYLAQVHWPVAEDFTSGSIKILLDHSATKKAIIEALRLVAQTCTMGDIVYFHFSGHGDVRETEVLCPSDYLADMNGNAIGPRDLAPIFQSMHAQGASLTWTSDACYAGDFARLGHDVPRRRIRTLNGRNASPRLAFGSVITDEAGKLRSARGDSSALFFSACNEQEEASEAVFEHANGVFTYYMLHELRLFRQLLRAEQDDHIKLCGPAHTAESLIARIRPDVDVFCMTPEAFGPAVRLKQPFLS